MSQTFFTVKTQFILILLILQHIIVINSKAQTFFYNPIQPTRPQLILISGCTGTGKSTFGMSVALSQGILRCLSTDLIRQVLRTSNTIDNPALYRSSYSGDGDPILQWKETCLVVEDAILGVITDAINRGNSLVLEGVAIVPSRAILDKWTSLGGVAMGCVMNIKDANEHRNLIYSRGEMTGKPEEKKLKQFERIRRIQDEIVRLGTENKWLIVEQRTALSPIEIIGEELRKYS